MRISGLFRDIFETQIALFDMAVRRIAELDEPADDNPLAEARRRGADLARVFGGAPGSYGAQAADTALDGDWRTRDELGEVYLAAVTHAYGGVEPVRAAGADFRDRVSEADALVHPQDDRERDLLDGDGVADFAGGFAAAAALLGNDPELYHLDTSMTDAPKARRLAEEIARIVRGRLTNPRWIAGMLAHGHRGVAEIAQGVDALFAFAATTRVVPDHLFDATHAALIVDEAVRTAMTEKNPAATAAIAARLRDALARGLWTTRRNAVDHELERAMLKARIMSAAASIEVKGWCPGALRPMLSGDGLIVRIRPFCGAFSLEQARGLADLARRLGNGHIDLTRRANLQLRGLSDERMPELHARAWQARPDRSRRRDRSHAQSHGRAAGGTGSRREDRRSPDRAGNRRRPCRRRIPARLAGQVRPAGRWRRHRLDRRRTRRHRAAGDRWRDRARPRHGGGHGLARRNTAGRGGNGGTCGGTRLP